MRCRDCRSWHDDGLGFEDGWAWCLKMTPQNRQFDTDAKARVDAISLDDVGVVTAPDFGCLMFEGRTSWPSIP